MEIKVKAIKTFYTKDGVRRKKNSTFIIDDIDRATNLESRKLIKTVSINKGEPKEINYDKDYTLKQLREMFPEIKAKTKKEFIEKIQEIK